ncbi:DUF5682 family protein [Nocardiopsis ganjiahuensis]|uniref:DUF5682 family protein n=1 Tax=Nocardiopsis ganjiahuensis TaxID=239984 RepID=UPI0003457D88|nr:DUF5682 family protein [Nocardiopsis ganjiahuensis]
MTAETAALPPGEGLAPASAVEELAACARPHLIGVRHHSPVLAAAMPSLLAAADPDAVLVELPAEAAPWLEWLGHADTVAPVALVLGTDSEHSFYPFADFSPELAALRWARTHGVPVQAIDLPVAQRARPTAPHPDPSPSDASASAPGLHGALLRAADVPDGEELWDRLVEARSYGAEPEQVRRAALALGWAHRAAGPPSPSDLAREAWMRAQLERTGARRPVAVIGSFHAAALLPGHTPPADTPVPTSLPTDATGPDPVTALIPYTFALLDSRSGYPAGIRDPEWQQDVYEAGADPERVERACVRRLAAVGAHLRSHGHVSGLPDTAAAHRMARDLAALRDLPAPGRRELVEGLSSAMAQGEPLGRGRALARAAQHVLVGSRRGRPAPQAPVSGLTAHVADLREQLSLPGPGSGRTDLRLDPHRTRTDRDRHVALHRMGAAGIVYAEPVEGGPTTDGETLGRRWEAHWSSGTDATLELASCYGATLEQAARGRLAARVREADSDGGDLAPGPAGQLLTLAAECALPDLVAELGRRVAEEVLPRTGLAEAVALHDRLQRIVAGRVPGMPHAPESLARLRVRLAEAAVASVPGTAGSTDPADAAALLRVVRLVQDQAALPGAVGSSRLLWHLGGLADRGGPLAQGAAAAALTLLGHLPPARLAARLAGWADDASDGTALARRLTGALVVAGPVLEADPEVLDTLTERVESWTDTGFLHRLPALREGFDSLSTAARARFLESVVDRFGDLDTELAVSPALAAALAAADTRARAAVESLLPHALQQTKIPTTTFTDTSADLPASTDTGTGTPTLPGLPPSPVSPDRPPAERLSTGPIPEESAAEPTSPAPSASSTTAASSSTPKSAVPASGAELPATASGIGAADRWRLVLGSPPREDDRTARRAATALDQLYGHGHGEGSHRPGGAARGGSERPEPAVRDWPEELQALFGATVREEVLGRAAERGRTDVLDHLDPERVTASVDLLEHVLSLAGALPEARLAKLRPIVARLTEQLVAQLARRLRPALNGLSVPRPTRRRGGRLDLGRTVRANLRTVRPGPEGPLLVPETPVFRTRARRSADWHVHIVVDVSGSMERSTIHAALVAAVLHGLPALSVSLTAFSTEVVDLTDRVHDPLSLLLEVSVGGGTDIGAGLAHTRDRVRVPSRTIVALITDFEEGGSLSRTLGEVRALAASGAHLLGLAALDSTGAAVCNQAIAARFVDAGMPVASLSPEELASWIGEKVRG